jgi:hypothetical protein
MIYLVTSCHSIYSGVQIYNAAVISLLSWSNNSSQIISAQSCRLFILAQFFFNPSLHINSPFRNSPDKEPADKGEKDTWVLC